MKKWFWILFAVFLPVAEVGVFVVVSRAIGLWMTLAIVGVSATCGVCILIRSALRIEREGDELKERYGKMEDAPTSQMLVVGTEWMYSIIAVLCLLSPGFLSDLFGLLLSLPGVKKSIGKASLLKAQVEAGQHGMGVDEYYRKKRLEGR